MNVSTSTGAPELLKLLAHDIRWQIVAALAHSDLRVQELVALVGRPINLVSYHLKQLRGQAIVDERRSSADGRDVYYSLDLRRLRDLYVQSGVQLHPALGAGAPGVAPPAAQPIRVLFLCTHNRARSQMAEALLRHLGGGTVAAFSAGSEPGVIHPLAVEALAELGIDMQGQRSKHLDEYRAEQFDTVISVCDRMREQCPIFGGNPDCIHWSISDPIAAAERMEDAAARLALFRQTAQELAIRISLFLQANGASPQLIRSKEPMFAP